MSTCAAPRTLSEDGLVFEAVVEGENGLVFEAVVEGENGLVFEADVESEGVCVFEACTHSCSEYEIELVACVLHCVLNGVRIGEPWV